MAQRASQLFDDLLSIEIDLVVSERAAHPLAEPGTLDDTTLLDQLAVTYRDYLDKHLPALDAKWVAWVASGEPAELARDTPAQLGALVRDGELLRQFEHDRSPDVLQRAGRDAALGEAMARARSPVGNQHPDPRVTHVLRRIRGSVAQLRATTDTERMRIARKAWELGTDTIVAQTVVQIDGDVIQRVDEFMFDAPAMWDLHRRAVANAVGQWQMLVELFIRVAVGAVGLVRSLFGGRTALRGWQARRRELGALSERGAWELWKPKVALTTWRDFVGAMRGLLADGGSTITTPSQQGASPYARTVIQPDGDSVWSITPAAAARREDLEVHAAAVTLWYADTRRVAATMERYLSTIQLAAATLLAGFGLLWVMVKGSWVSIVTGLLATIVLPWVLRRLVGWYIRRRTKAMFK